MRFTCEHNGNEFTLDVPMSVGVLKYGDVIDFRAHEQESFGLQEEGEELDALISLNSAVLCLVSGDLQYVPNHLEGEDPAQLIDGGYQLTIGDDLSMARLYAHLVNMIEAYKPTGELPNDFFIDWHEVREVRERNKWPQRAIDWLLKREPVYTTKKAPCKYYIEPDRARRLLTEKAYTNGETLELLEFRRNIDETIKEKGDPQGNLAFTLSLQQMSILLRKQGEVLPSNKAERKTFIDQRSRLFADLPYDTVLNVRFFLIGLLVESSQTPVTRYS